MSDIKQLLEKATRKTEMNWRVFAYDPEKDNKLVHTSKEAFPCIKMAGEYKMDLAKKNPNYIIEIIAESAQKNEAKTFVVVAYNNGKKVKEAVAEDFLDAKRIMSNLAIRFNDVKILEDGKVIKSTIESSQKNETKDYKVGDFVKADFNWRGVHAKPVEGKIIEKRKAMAGGGDPQPGFEYLVKAKDGNSYWVHQYGILESAQKNEAGYRPDKEVLVDAEKQLKFAKDKLAQTKDFNLQQQYKRAIEYWEGLIAYTKKNPIKESSQKNEEKEFTIKLVTPFGKAKVCSWKANSVDAAVKEFLDANPAYRENKKGAVIAESAQKNEAAKTCSTKEDFNKVISILDKTLNKAKSKFSGTTIENNVRTPSMQEVFTKCLVFNGNTDEDKRKANEVEKMLVDAIKAANFYIAKVDTMYLPYFISNTKYSQMVSVGVARNYKSYFVGYDINRESLRALESIGDDIIREVKEEVKDGVKDLVQQDVDSKLNGEVTPEDYIQTYSEDIDDDSDSIFGDELDNAEPDELEQE